MVFVNIQWRIEKMTAAPFKSMRPISPVVRDIFFVISLANLCFLKVWTGYLFYDDAKKYPVFVMPNASCYAALIVNVFLTAFLLYSVIYLYRKVTHPAMTIFTRLFFAVIILNILNVIRKVYIGVSIQQFLIVGSSHLKIFHIGLLFLVISLLAVLTMLFYRKLYRSLRMLTITGVICMFPFSMYTLAQAGINIIQYRAGTGPFSKTGISAVNAPSPAKVHSRVLWIVFDEWDRRLAVIDKPSYLQIPEILKIRAHSLYSINAYPPGKETMVSLPSLIEGRLLSQVRPVGIHQAKVVYSDTGKSSIWGENPNIFSRLKAMGCKSALIGWYHPYEAVLGKNLDFCSQIHGEYFYTRNSGDFFGNMTEQLLHLLPFMAVLEHIDAYNETMKVARKIAVAPDYNLVFIHFPIPHSPFIYDTKKQKLSPWVDQNRGYFYNLALMDKTLGEIRGLMEKSGLWDGTAVILSTDHFCRYSKNIDGKEDPRIPFMVKMPGQKDSYEYKPRFNTVLTQDLVLAILKEEVRTNREVVDWLDRHRKLYGNITGGIGQREGISDD